MIVQSRVLTTDPSHILNSLEPARTAGPTCGRGLAALACMAALLSFVPAADANTISTYTSTSNCNSTNTGWTVTNTCTTTTSVGVNAPHAVQNGVQYDPLGNPSLPTATIRDQYGNPIQVGGQIMTLTLSAAVTQKVTNERGTIDSAHVWAGFESNVTLDPPDTASTMSTIYVVTFSWPAPVGPQGATWCSNNGDDLWGDTVYDAFGLLPSLAGSPMCFGDGSGTACPCANAGATSNGCASSSNPIGAHLGASGTPSISADSLSLTASGMGATAPALYFQGTTSPQGGAGVVFGDGLRCAGGTVVRLVVKSSTSGWSTYPGAGDPSISVKGSVTSPGVRIYQAWFRDAVPFCTTSTFNLTNGHQVTWIN